MARRPRQNNETLIELFLDMLAAERGASANTLDAYRRDLADFSAIGDQAARSPRPTATRCAPISASSPSAGSRRPRWRGGCRRSASFIASSTAKATARTIRPPRSKGPKRGRALPKVLSVKQVDDLLATGARWHERREREIRTAARRAAQLPAGNSLRHGPARLRTGGAAGGRGAARPAHAGDPRQRRTRAAGAAQRRGQPHHGRLSGAARARPSSDRSPNGCSRHSARAGT